MDESKARKDEELKKDAVALQAKIDEIWKKYNDDLTNFFWYKVNIYKQASDFNNAVKDVFPDKQVEFWEVAKTIKTKAENKFDELKVKAQKAMKIQAEAKIKEFNATAEKWNIEFDNEAIQRKLADIPLSIEEKIQGVKDTLDAILGRKLDAALNPELPSFNLEVILAKMQAIIDPLLAAVGPIESVGGSIPILGDLAGMFGILSSGSGGKKLTKEQIKKLVPKLPSLPDNLSDVVKGIFDDICIAGQMMPMILINVIFQMLDTIVGMFNQIAGIIGVPPIPFPLSLIPQCIEAIPLMWDFMIKVPVLMGASVKGLLIDKLAEAMALAVPEPNINIAAIELGDVANASVTPKIEEPEPEKPAAKSTPVTKNIEYKDVIKDKLVDVSKFGYNRTDLQRILKSYEEIYDGSNGTISKYTGFSGTSDQGNMIPTKETITRTKGTPEGFKKELDKVFSTPKISEEVTYDRIKKTTSVVGAQYYKYEDQIKSVEPNDNVILEDTITP